jgi:hypothetical protein
MSRKIIYPPKQCAACGNMFSKQPNESAQRYADKTYCGRSCSARTRSSPPPKPFSEELKGCKHCGALMQPHHNEPGYRYRERKTCNKMCGYALQRGKRSNVLSSRTEQHEPSIRRTSSLI